MSGGNGEKCVVDEVDFELAMRLYARGWSLMLWQPGDPSCLWLLVPEREEDAARRLARALRGS